MEEAQATLGPVLAVFLSMNNQTSASKAIAELGWQPGNHLALLDDNALYLDTGRNKVLIDTGADRELGPTLGWLAANLQASRVTCTGRRFSKVAIR